MKTLFFYFLLLFMIFGCNSDGNSTTTLPTSINSITSVKLINASTTTTTTIAPTTTIITIPRTTVTPPVTTTSSYDDSKHFDYQVCGNSTKEPDCSCYNETLSCSPIKERCYSYWRWRCPYHPSFNSTNIKILDESFVVKTVNFKDNNLTIIKKDKLLPGHEHTVETLKLRANKIYSIENGAFDKFIALKDLDLSYNYLKNLTAAVFSPEIGSTLERLDIGDNLFNSILDLDFSNFVQLKNLILYNNWRIGKNNHTFSKYIFPEALANLTRLQLSHCAITAINDKTFMNLRSLETLLLYSNPLTTFPKAIYSLTNLKYLDLDGTQITTLNYTALNVTTMKLEKLTMCSSALTIIDDCAFCNFPNLKELLLWRNPHLSYIHENAFGYAYNESSPPLEKFSIEFGNLSIIPEELLNWHAVAEFGLGNNPFICNCSMAWLINDLLSPTHTANLKDIAPSSGESNIEQDFKCTAPYSLRGIPFIQISRHFCPNEVVKKECIKEKIVTAEQQPFSWFHITAVILSSLVCFVLGIVVVPLFRYLHRRPKKQHQGGFDNQNFHEDLIDEDFDDRHEKF